MSKCDLCGGYGYIQKDDGYMGMPEAVQCTCVVERALNQQAEKAWTGLSRIPPKKKGVVLKGKISTNLVITAEKTEIESALRNALWVESKPILFIKVVSDATLMSAWLSNLSRMGEDIIDPDFQRDIKVAALEDLAESPNLLVIRLGVKMAKNSQMAAVLLETIELRQHLNKATWIIEEPRKPLAEGHLAWSLAVQEALEGWERIRLVGKVKGTIEGGSDTLKISSNTTNQDLRVEQLLPAGRHMTVKL
jgi:hypothetical protein